jgi:hypothetical protein
LEGFKVNINEIHKLNEEQLKQLKESLIQDSGHFFLKDFEKTYAVEQFHSKFIETIQSNIVDILSKKLPTEINFNNAKLE